MIIEEARLEDAVDHAANVDLDQGVAHVPRGGIVLGLNREVLVDLEGGMVVDMGGVGHIVVLGGIDLPPVEIGIGIAIEVCRLRMEKKVGYLR